MGAATLKLREAVWRAPFDVRRDGWLRLVVGSADGPTEALLEGELVGLGRAASSPSSRPAPGVGLRLVVASDRREALAWDLEPLRVRLSERWPNREVQVWQLFEETTPELELSGGAERRIQFVPSSPLSDRDRADVLRVLCSELARGRTEDLAWLGEARWALTLRRDDAAARDELQSIADRLREVRDDERQRLGRPPTGTSKPMTPVRRAGAADGERPATARTESERRPAAGVLSAAALVLMMGCAFGGWFTLELELAELASSPLAMVVGMALLLGFAGLVWFIAARGFYGYPVSVDVLEPVATGVERARGGWTSALLELSERNLDLVTPRREHRLWRACDEAVGRWYEAVAPQLSSLHLTSDGVAEPATLGYGSRRLGAGAVSLELTPR